MELIIVHLNSHGIDHHETITDLRSSKVRSHIVSLQGKGAWFAATPPPPLPDFIIVNMIIPVYTIVSPRWKWAWVCQINCSLPKILSITSIYSNNYDGMGIFIGNCPFRWNSFGDCTSKRVWLQSWSMTCNDVLCSIHLYWPHAHEARVLCSHFLTDLSLTKFHESPFKSLTKVVILLTVTSI